MGESFTIQISSNLVRNLVDDGEKVKKKTRKLKPKPPLYSPIPPQKPANTELDAIWSAIQESEKVVERLQKQEANMLQEVTQRAKDLHDKEFKLPSRKPMPCLDQKDACLNCYKEHVKDL
ncbi:hypothetical protein Sango_2279300 [Sesamum angolense]|uniref:Uncharacterized protein n=1 Tax=Sesamum angolense TaxID=2727404 RepID=A0AAE1W9V9_9LAMI|nr:hypothetical protein Sango_2279300 [Sesamum angolense]